MRSIIHWLVVAALVLVSSTSEARWLSVDPVEANANNGQNFNRYYYANNNPYRFTDPDGRQAAERQIERYRKDAQEGNWAVYKPFEKPAIAITTAMLFGPGAGAAYSRAMVWAGENYGAVQAATNIATSVCGVTGVNAMSGGGLMGQAANVLKPEGQLLGRAGTSNAIRMVEGGLSGARSTFNQAVRGGEIVQGTSYPGTLVRMSDNALIGLRETSTRGSQPPTIDLMGKGWKGFGAREFKFYQEGPK